MQEEKRRERVDREARCVMETLRDRLRWTPTLHRRGNSEDCCKVLMLTGSRVFETGGEISMDFITQRVEIDDPITGYMVRTTAGNQLQGFVWYTTFTVWTFFFKWDSSATQAGLRRKDAKAGRKIDVDGSLARELEMQCRSGHPDEEGVVFPNIAEVAVAGALGCGSKLMQRILDDIRDKGVYNYVVVQATEGSIKFYERFGFRRVGAVARYNKRYAGDPREVIGYRHWLHADEKLHVTDRPSYMMAYKVVGDRKPQPKTEARAASAYSLRSLGRRAASFLFDNRTRLLSPTSFSRNKRLAQPQVPEVVPSPPLKRRRVHS